MTQAQIDIPEKRLFRLDEVATLLGVSRWTVQRMVLAGELQAVCLRPRVRRIPLASLQRLLADR